MPAERVGRLIVVKGTAVAGRGGAGVVVYARVSWRDQRVDLERRVARLTVWATAKDVKVGSWSPRLDPA